MMIYASANTHPYIPIDNNGYPWVPQLPTSITKHALT